MICVVRQTADGRIVCGPIDMLSPQLVVGDRVGQMIPVQTAIGDFHRQVVPELMLQREVPLVGVTRVSLFVKVEPPCRAAQKNPLEALIAAGEILDARRERVAHIREERAVVVDAGHDGIRALDDGPVDAVLESHRRRSNEGAGTAAQDRVLAKLIREADSRYRAPTPVS